MEKKLKKIMNVKNLIFTLAMVALVCSAGMFSSCGSSDDDDEQEKPGVVYDHTKDGLVGKWYSSGSNVAPLFIQYALADSAYIVFKNDNTYVGATFWQGARTSLSGTYTQTKSSVGNIWTILLHQTSPSSVTSEGIFEITKSGDTYLMKYEIVQTEPALGTAPTPEGGFGSSSGGVYGEGFVQKYIRIPDVVYDPTKDGIAGEWYSSGNNIAPLFITYNLADSAYIVFKNDNTYVGATFWQGARTNLSGTYIQTKSNVGNIWTILLHQTLPSSVTSEGIFEISKSGGTYLMKYEIVQTEPMLGTAPTPAGGFGSSSGGVYGEGFVQKYIRIME
ncbi:MAG: hypothetical protein LBP63_09110 [Prevotellaceae bacterium]|jgi:hypothetical protein|nr:hypothetical protein [Prevotellaceae bacterium]